MKTQLTLNIPLSRSNRDEGIQRAVDSAERKDAGWKEKAYDAFKTWLSKWPKGFVFQIEDFRASSDVMKLPPPPSHRAYGFIPIKARKEGLIKSNGMKATRSATAHRCFASEWQKV